MQWLAEMCYMPLSPNAVRLPPHNGLRSSIHHPKKTDSEKVGKCNPINHAMAELFQQKNVVKNSYSNDTMADTMADAMVDEIADTTVDAMVGTMADAMVDLTFDAMVDAMADAW